MHITEETKALLKAQRLEQYSAQIYSLEMDLAAYNALGDEENATKTIQSIESGKKAFAAVEAMQ